MNALTLKNSILQLAVQGRLVPQDISDEPAILMISRIRKEKEQLVRSGRIKKEKELAPILDDEVPYSLPRGWSWVRLGDYCERITDQVASGSFASLRDNVKSLKVPSYALMVKTADFANGFTNNLTYTDEHGYHFLENSNLFGGELILSNIGSIGKVFIVPKMNMPMTLAPNSVMVRLMSDAQRDYLYWFLLSPQGYDELMEITSGTAMKKFNKTDLKTILIPVPPINEQARIVVKINELLPLIESYGKSQDELDILNKILPDKLRKSVLQEAIHGNLVPNDIPEGDATASELLQQILKERQDRENKAKGKKAKKLSLSTIEEDPWNLPEGWCWCRGKDIFFPMESIKPTSDFVYIDTDAVNNKKNIIDNPKKVLLKDAPSRATRKLHTNDILFSMVRPYLKNIAFVDERFGTAIGTTGFYVITTSATLYQPYIFKMMLSDYVVSGLTDYMKGDNSPSINNGHIEEFLYPIPPLSIQHRIVEKIEEVFAAINKLQA